MTVPASSLRVAILIHTDDAVPLQMMRDSYVNIFDKLAPGSKLEFYNLLLSPQLPSLSSTSPYDLVILGGGTFIPQPNVQWLKTLEEFEKKLLYEHNAQKVIGICLGHQTLARVGNAPLEYLAKPELAVYDLELTEEGTKFFGKTSLRMHEFHQRYVSTPPAGFKELAKDCQILMSQDERILTFQGHPEMTDDLMSLLLESPASKASGYIDFDADADGSFRGKLMESAAAEHDGLDIFRSVIAWGSRR